MHETVKGFSPLIKVLKSLVKVVLNLLKQSSRLHLVIVHIYFDVAFNHFEWIVKSMRVLFDYLLNFLVNNSRLRSVDNCH